MGAERSHLSCSRRSLSCRGQAFHSGKPKPLLIPCFLCHFCLLSIIIILLNKNSSLVEFFYCDAALSLFFLLTHLLYLQGLVPFVSLETALYCSVSPACEVSDHQSSELRVVLLVMYRFLLLLLARLSYCVHSSGLWATHFQIFKPGMGNVCSLDVVRTVGDSIHGKLEIGNSEDEWLNAFYTIDLEVGNIYLSICCWITPLTIPNH